MWGIAHGEPPSSAPSLSKIAYAAAFPGNNANLTREYRAISTKISTAGTRNSTPMLAKTKPAPKLITIGTRNWMASLLS